MNLANDRHRVIGHASYINRIFRVDIVKRHKLNNYSAKS
jgi:hypothetical protein